jgi:replicative DNA helicase
MDGVYSLQEAMTTGSQTSLADNPSRLHFPWESVNKMVHLLPGSVLSVFATQSGIGKTTWCMNLLLDAAKRGEVILNYSAELTTEEYSVIVASHVLRKDRTSIGEQDRKEAAKHIGNIKFYIGRDPDLSTIGGVLDLVEAAIRRLGATVVCIDHLHYLVRNEQDTVKAQENAMQRIKRLAVKYGCKIIVVGQPRKATQQSKGKLVGMSDAKGSESFSSDSDALIALHRELVKNIDPEHPPKEPYDSKTQIHLLKGRSQGSGNAYCELVFLGTLATFADVAFEPEAGLNFGQ